MMTVKYWIDGGYPFWSVRQAYIKTDLLLSGQTEEAKVYLLWVKENGNKNFLEYALAVTQLERLKKE